MYWEENDTPEETSLSTGIVDMVFSISCRSLPVDHAYSLSQAIAEHLPWFLQEPDAGMHTIHVAETANGWFRPDNPDDVLYPSRRTKFTLRVPKHRVDDAHQLSGKTIMLSGNELLFKQAVIRELSPIATQFSRYVSYAGVQQESEFMQRVFDELQAKGIKPKKMLCGIERVFITPDENINSRSLMIADLKQEEAILLQQRGVGEFRHIGCGLFMPHKDINEISEDQG